MRETFGHVTASIAASYRRLSGRERVLVVAFGVLAVCAFLYVGIVEPIANARASARNRIVSLRRDLGRMQSLADRIRILESDVAAPREQTETSDGFSLFSFMDKATSSTVNPDAVASMNPSKRRVRDGVEENAVEVRLTTVSLSEIVGLLRRIEEADQPVYLKRVDLKRRFDDRTRFDAIIIAGATSRT